jgi:hypothetical protein
MTKQSPNEPTAADFVDLALSRIPSAFGKLAFVAGLRQMNPDRDYYPAAIAAYGKEQIDAACRWKHREIFYAWQCAPLATQTEEVAQYLADQGNGDNAPIAQTIQQWIQERSYEKLIPEAAGEQERDLFSSDLRAILQLLQVRLMTADVVSRRELG